MCWARSLSHLNFPLSIIDKVMLLIVLLKVFDMENYLLVGIMTGSLIVFGLILGHWDVKYGIMEKENSLNNKHNREIQTLLNYKR